MKKRKPRRSRPRGLAVSGAALAQFASLQKHKSATAFARWKTASTNSASGPRTGPNRDRSRRRRPGLRTHEGPGHDRIAEGGRQGEKDELDEALGDLNRSTNRLRRKFDPMDKWMETRPQVENVLEDARKYQPGAGAWEIRHAGRALLECAAGEHQRSGPLLQPDAVGSVIHAAPPPLGLGALETAGATRDQSTRVPMRVGGPGLGPVRSARARAVPAGGADAAGQPGAAADDARGPDRVRAPAEARDAVARAGAPARRPGQPPPRSRPDRRDPDRRRQQRVAVDSRGHPPGATARPTASATGARICSTTSSPCGPPLAARSPAHSSTTASCELNRVRRFGGRLHQRLCEVRTIPADGLLRSRRRLPEGRPHPISAEYGVGRGPGWLPLHARGERRHRTRLRRRAHGSSRTAVRSRRSRPGSTRPRRPDCSTTPGLPRGARSRDSTSGT